MTFVVGIPFLAEKDLLLECLRSVWNGNLHPSRVILVDNGGFLPDYFRTPLTSLIRPEQNLGVAASWNLIHKLAAPLPVVLVNDDTALAYDTLKEMMAEPGPTVVCAWGYNTVRIDHEIWEEVGDFDEKFYPAYCLTPDTPVLLNDLSWVPIGQLSVGSELVGVEEFPLSNQSSRRYMPATVTKIVRRSAPIMKISFEDGRSIRCTGDHRWLSKPPARSEHYKWRYARELKANYKMAAPLDVWKTDTSYDGGWLAGILDGEGTLRAQNHGRIKCGISFVQKEGLVLDKAKRVLEQLGIPYTWRIRPKEKVVNVEISIRRFVFQALGSLRPVRLLQSRVWTGKHLRSRGSKNTADQNLNVLIISNIESAGTSEVVTIETTTRTFLANGLVSHNCEDADHRYRCKVAGVNYVDWNAEPTEEVSPGRRRSVHGILHGKPVPPHYETLWFKEQIEKNKRYYEQKWGGPIGKELYRRPFG